MSGARGGRLTTWRLALRIARREAVRAKGRSALVVAMIALPILGVSAADLALRSSELSPQEQLTREMGRAEARFRVETDGTPVLQSPEADEVLYVDPETEGLPDARPTTPGEVAERLRALLPPGTEVYSDESTEAVVHTRSGLMSGVLREVEAGPVTEGMITLLRGHYPEDPAEVMATESFLDESGLHVGSELRLRDGDRTFRIVGAYELPGSLDATEVTGLPGSLLAALPEERRSAYLGGTALLADVPARAGGAVTWEMVVAANEQGLTAESKAVVANPPPDSEVPLYAEGDRSYASSAVDGRVVAAAVTVVSLIILEICLLAGPAFAVGARRSRRQLGLMGANGGDRRHLRAVMLASGVVLGAVAAVVGVAGGLLLTLAAHPLIERQAGSRFGAWDLRLAEQAAIAGLAVLVGLLAALVPALNAARSPVLESLTGRRGTRRANRALPVTGAVALVLGAALATAGAALFDGTTVVAVGAVLAELGLVAMTPVLVGLFGRLGRRLPLSGRLALRDAARNRGRTAPAVAAVLAAVAGTVAVATYMISDDAEQRARYEAMLPEGAVSLTAWEEQDRAALDRAAALAERQLPVAERADRGEVVPARDCDVFSGEDCGVAEVVVPERHVCPLYAPGSENLTEAQRLEYGQDWRCEAEGGFSSGSGMAVGGPELLRVLGVPENEVREAAAALEAGEAVVFSDRWTDAEGTVTTRVWEGAPEYGEDGEIAEEPDVTAAFPAHRAEGESYGLPPLISPEAARDAGLTVIPTTVYYSTERVPTGEEQQRLEAGLAALGTPPSLYVEDGYDGDPTAALLILSVAAMIITLGAAGIATGLAQADSEADLATLAAVGATPRVRRTLSGLQCGVIAAMGVLLGAASGLIPALGLRLADHRSDVAFWEQGVAQGWADGARPALFIELPWGTFLQLLVVVPLVACLVAALLTRSRIHLARRAG
ncbi:ABC transporter permease [Streptomyces sp. DSM 44917]|uniref:ABC transporter permease n=1 Tax=Streptomyces boetiae TaxID=3075541 RepID=A0ABU2L6D3_9ACTN|nr:FtsX-like permease family protein [Streptomyces sp. DSM 44917]MDT0307111.1 ABC transporter permease [Streptomyces sp. DSM 44917]